MSVTQQLPEKYISQKHGGRKLNPEFVALWESYLDEGMPYLYVAEMFGVSKDAVRRHYPGRGWTSAEVSAHGTFMRRHNKEMRKVLKRY